MEVKRKKCKVRMLPTEDETLVLCNTYLDDTILNNKDTLELHFNFTDKQLEIKGYKHQHLYIISDDKIKEGDWFLDLSTNEIFKATRISEQDKTSVFFFKNPSDDYDYVANKPMKIIATTDTSLWYNVYKNGEDTGANKILPQPSKAFIQKYCDLGGIDEIDVEYNYVKECVKCKRKHFDDPYYCECGEGDNFNIDLILKINLHNEITIHPIKNSWTREDIIHLVYQATKEVPNEDYDTVLEWVNKNLN